MKVKLNAYQKKELERKRIHKVATLKKYAKLCKAEGIKSDRVNLSTNTKKSEKNETDAPSEKSSSSHHGSSGSYKSKKSGQDKKPKKEEPLTREEQKKEIQSQLTERIKGIEEALKKRKELKKSMTQKTAKGQPVMKGRINNILQKLMSQK
jgi:hypothetical protein